MKKNIKYIFSIFVAIVVAAYIFWVNRPTGTPVTTTTNAGNDNENSPTPSGTDASAGSQGNSPTPSYVFANNLGFGSTGADVTALQQLLINQGYLTAVSSPTGYFGPLTKAALTKFQTKNNVALATGYFGVQTRAIVNGSGASLTGSASPSTASTGYKDGAYTGTTADAVYGQLQVAVTISGGKITDVTFPVFPNSPGHTSQISASALPTLKQEAIASQSANVNIVSGATQDSQAFQESLASALAMAKS